MEPSYKSNTFGTLTEFIGQSWHVQCTTPPLRTVGSYKTGRRTYVDAQDDSGHTVLGCQILSTWTTAYNEQSWVVENCVDADDDDGNLTVFGRRKQRRRPDDDDSGPWMSNLCRQIGRLP